MKIKFVVPGLAFLATLIGCSSTSKEPVTPQTVYQRKIDSLNLNQSRVELDNARIMLSRSINELRNGGNVNLAINYSHKAQSYLNPDIPEHALYLSYVYRTLISGYHTLGDSENLKKTSEQIDGFINFLKKYDKEHVANLSKEFERRKKGDDPVLSLERLLVLELPVPQLQR